MAKRTTLIFLLLLLTFSEKGLAKKGREKYESISK